MRFLGFVSPVQRAVEQRRGRRRAVARRRLRDGRARGHGASAAGDRERGRRASRDRRRRRDRPRRSARGRRALAEAIVALAARPPRAAEMGRAARERALAEFTPERCVERIEALYARTLSPRRRSGAVGVSAHAPTLTRARRRRGARAGSPTARGSGSCPRRPSPRACCRRAAAARAPTKRARRDEDAGEREGVERDHVRGLDRSSARCRARRFRARPSRPRHRVPEHPRRLARAASPSRPDARARSRRPRARYRRIWAHSSTVVGLPASVRSAASSGQGGPPGSSGHVVDPAAAIESLAYVFSLFAFQSARDVRRDRVAADLHLVPHDPRCDHHRGHAEDECRRSHAVARGRAPRDVDGERRAGARSAACCRGWRAPATAPDAAREPERLPLVGDECAEREQRQRRSWSRISRFTWTSCQTRYGCSVAIERGDQADAGRAGAASRSRRRRAPCAAATAICASPTDEPGATERPVDGGEEPAVQRLGVRRRHARGRSRTSRSSTSVCAKWSLFSVNASRIVSRSRASTSEPRQRPRRRPRQRQPSTVSSLRRRWAPRRGNGTRSSPATSSDRSTTASGRASPRSRSARPGGFAIAALMRPPDPAHGEDEAIVARAGAARRPPAGPLGHHTHWTAPDHARPTRQAILARACASEGRVAARARARSRRSSAAAAGTRTPRSQRRAPSSATSTAPPTAYRPPYLAPGGAAARARRARARRAPLGRAAARAPVDALARRCSPAGAAAGGLARAVVHVLLPRHRSPRPPPRVRFCALVSACSRAGARVLDLDALAAARSPLRRASRGTTWRGLSFHDMSGQARAADGDARVRRRRPTRGGSWRADVRRRPRLYLLSRGPIGRARPALASVAALVALDVARARARDLRRARRARSSSTGSRRPLEPALATRPARSGSGSLAPITLLVFWQAGLYAAARAAAGRGPHRLRRLDPRRADRARVRDRHGLRLLDLRARSRRRRSPRRDRDRRSSAPPTSRSRSRLMRAVGRAPPGVLVGEGESLAHLQQLARLARGAASSTRSSARTQSAPPRPASCSAGSTTLLDSRRATTS